MTYSLVKEIADIIDSLHKTPSYEDTGHPMVRVVDVKYGALNLSNTKKVSEAVYSEFSRRYTPEIDDIVITRVGSYGISALVKNTHFCLGQNTAAIKPKIDKHYFFYALNSPALQQEIEYSTVGSTQKTLSLKAIGNLKIPRFDERAEKKIGKILSVLDDKIENNRRMNETLEEMARAIFKSWFVDFDPVHAKAAGNAPVHMDADTAALFPSSFGDDGLPEGWNTGKIEDIVDRQRAGKLFSKKTVKIVGKVPVLDQSATGIIGFHNEEASIFASPSDRIITFANHTCVLRLVESNFSAIQNVIPYKGKKYPTEWVLYASQNKQRFEEYKGHWPTFLVQSVILPDARTASLFANLVEPIVSKIFANTEESQTLAELRDTLLPKLMSGEIRVADAEREVEAAI